MGHGNFHLKGGCWAGSKTKNGSNISCKRPDSSLMTLLWTSVHCA